MTSRREFLEFVAFSALVVVTVWALALVLARP
jgi:hypothetical protein